MSARGRFPGRYLREDQGRPAASSAQGATVIDGGRTFELLRFADAVQCVAVEVRCAEPLRMGEERYYAAEIVLASDFVNGRVGLQVSLGDLDEWERCLDALQADEGAQWPAGGHSAARGTDNGLVHGRSLGRASSRRPSLPGPFRAAVLFVVFGSSWTSANPLSPRGAFTRDADSFRAAMSSESFPSATGVRVLGHLDALHPADPDLMRRECSSFRYPVYRRAVPPESPEPASSPPLAWGVARPQAAASEAPADSVGLS